MITRTIPRSWARAVVVLRAGTLVALAVYGVWIVTGGPRGAGGETLDAWLSNVVLLLAATLALARPLLVAEGRRTWLFLGLGLSAWVLGDLWWTLVLRHLDPQPFPSVADALYLAFYPCAYVTLVSFLRARTPNFLASAWLDGLVGALGVGALGTALAFRPILAGTDGSPAAIAVNLAYPLADLLLVALVVGILSFLRWNVHGPWVVLTAGFVVFGVADTTYLFQVATDTYRQGTFLDFLWPLGVVLMALGAWREPRRRPVLRLEGWTVLVVPSVVTVLATGLLVYDHAHRLPTLAVVLATLTLLTAGLRTALTLREVRALAESRLEARTDDLTGLGNRRYFYEQLGATLGRRGPAEHVAVLLVDLDRFKEVNDALGHDVGDELLTQIGPRLAGDLRSDDTLARLGGDEFAVVLGPPADEAMALAVADRLRQALTRPFVLDGLAVHLDASVGIALSPEHGLDPNLLLKRADVAMYRAKAARTGRELYVPDHDEHSRERLLVIEALRDAVYGRALELHYQPKADLLSGEVLSVEALVRWPHPTLGLLTPDRFLPLAEHTGLLRPLTDAVLDLALRQARHWRDEGYDLPLAINLTLADLLDVGFAAHVARSLAEAGLPVSALQVEITETVLMTDPQARAGVDRLAALGVQVAVDDYGTGYSSLAHLRDLPVHELKLDRSFVTPLPGDPRAVAIVRSTVELAHALGLALVAEGVETNAQWATLTELGCDLAQGYHLARPLPAADLTRWLQERDVTAPPAPAPQAARA